MEKVFEDFDVNSFKTAVINAICENSEIVYILDKEYIDSGGGLLWNKLFPYPRIPNTKEETTPYICFKVDHIKNKNAFIETIDVVIYVVCHQKEMNKKVLDYKTGETLSGTVIDIIGEELKKSLCGLETNWIGELSLYSNTEETFSYEYPYRALTFTAMKQSYEHYK